MGREAGWQWPALYTAAIFTMFGLMMPSQPVFVDHALPPQVWRQLNGTHQVPSATGVGWHGKQAAHGQ